MEPCMGPRKGSAAASQEPRCGLANLAGDWQGLRGGLRRSLAWGPCMGLPKVCSSFAGAALWPRTSRE